MKKMQRGFTIMARPCNQCLFSKNRLVPVKRAQEIVRACVRKGKHFTCHKAQIAGRDVCCHGFFKRFPDNTAGMRFSQALGLNIFVEQEELHEQAATQSE